MNPVEFRRHLHAHPELSFREHGTAAFIEQQLTELGIEHRRIASTGVLARIEGRKTPAGDRRAVVLRADTDALPIAERNDCAWRSQNEGVMHACGHDMHAAVLFGVLKEFAAEPDFRGTLFGLFQPGEECNPGGASLVLAEKPFDGYDVRAVVGEHVEPQLEVGTLGFRAGKYMAASDELRFRIHGTGGHGAMRKQLKDPVAAGAELLTRLIALNGEECVLSIGRVEAGGATNIVPDEVYMEGTLRTFDERERGIIHRRIGIIAADIDKRHGVQTDVEIGRGYPCVVNDETLFDDADPNTQKDSAWKCCRCGPRPRISASIADNIRRCSTGWAWAPQPDGPIRRRSHPTKGPWTWASASCAAWPCKFWKKDEKTEPTLRKRSPENGPRIGHTEPAARIPQQ